MAPKQFPYVPPELLARLDGGKAGAAAGYKTPTLSHKPFYFTAKL